MATIREKRHSLVANKEYHVIDPREGFSDPAQDVHESFALDGGNNTIKSRHSDDGTFDPESYCLEYLFATSNDDDKDFNLVETVSTNNGNLVLASKLSADQVFDKTMPASPRRKSSFFEVASSMMASIREGRSIPSSTRSMASCDKSSHASTVHAELGFALTIASSANDTSSAKDALGNKCDDTLNQEGRFDVNESGDSSIHVESGVYPFVTCANLGTTTSTVVATNFMVNYQATNITYNKTIKCPQVSLIRHQTITLLSILAKRPPAQSCARLHKKCQTLQALSPHQRCHIDSFKWHQVSFRQFEMESR
ncbi:unnamed protein product [Phytophthora lilii]|uniref:Unnamed protein product n=1 Tax=Phytophthora lilii TaxID=2077276 RepID=A0A9W6X5K7_9STRA|nr:unnamed protein product [Phytophthora lilii]